MGGHAAQHAPIVISSVVEKSKQLYSCGLNGWLFRADEISPLHSLSLVPVEMTSNGAVRIPHFLSLSNIL